MIGSEEAADFLVVLVVVVVLGLPDEEKNRARRRGRGRKRSGGIFPDRARGRRLLGPPDGKAIEYDERTRTKKKRRDFS